MTESVAFSVYSPLFVRKCVTKLQVSDRMDNTAKLKKTKIDLETESLTKTAIIVRVNRDLFGCEFLDG